MSYSITQLVNCSLISYYILQGDESQCFYLLSNGYAEILPERVTFLTNLFKLNGYWVIAALRKWVHELIQQMTGKLIIFATTLNLFLGPHPSVNVSRSEKE